MDPRCTKMTPNGSKRPKITPRPTLSHQDGPNMSPDGPRVSQHGIRVYLRGVTGCVSSVVLGPGMMCPYVIGRDSWDRGGQESVVRPDFNSPQDLGEEALTERTRLTVETDFPDNIVIVVVAVVFC